MAFAASGERRDEEIEALQAIYCDGALEVDRGQFPGSIIVLSFNVCSISVPERLHMQSRHLQWMVKTDMHARTIAHQ